MKIKVDRDFNRRWAGSESFIYSLCVNVFFFPFLSHPFIFSIYPLPNTTNMAISIQSVATTPFEGQKPGTSGLRKRVKIFQQRHYTENFIQAILDAIPQSEGGAKGATLIVGGDGRYYLDEVLQIIVKISAAAGVSGICTCLYVLGKLTSQNCRSANWSLEEMASYLHLLLLI
jgi:hypothetical protein